MVGISATTPQTVTTQSQSRIDSSNPQFREGKSIRDRLDLTSPRGSSLSRTQESETRNYQDTEKLMAEQRKTDLESGPVTGKRRGSLLDMSV